MIYKPYRFEDGDYACSEIHGIKLTYDIQHGITCIIFNTNIRTLFDI